MTDPDKELYDQGSRRPTRKVQAAFWAVPFAPVISWAAQTYLGMPPYAAESLGAGAVAAVAYFTRSKVGD